VERAQLEDGAEFQLGEVLLRFRTDAAARLAPGAQLEPAPTVASESGPRMSARAPAPAVSKEPGEPKQSDEIELEGEWTEPAQRVIAPSRAEPQSMPTAAVPIRPAPATALQRAAAAEAARRGSSAAPNAASARSVLQFQRFEDQGGFLASDLGQQPLWVKTVLAIVLLALFAGLFWGAFRVTAYLRSSGVARTENVEQR